MIKILYLLLFSSILLLCIMTIKIQIKVQDIKSHFNTNFKIIIQIFIFQSIPIIKLKINKQKMDKLNKKAHIQQKVEKIIKKQDFTKMIDSKERKNIWQLVKNIAQNIKLEIKEMDLKVEVGAENVILTSFLVPIISTILAFIIVKSQSQGVRKTNNNNDNEKNDSIYYKVIPKYENKNLINFELNGIFEIKMIHIINTICILKRKRRVGKNERTSDRRAYDNCYE